VFVSRVQVRGSLSENEIKQTRVRPKRHSGKSYLQGKKGVPFSKGGSSGTENYLTMFRPKDGKVRQN